MYLSGKQVPFRKSNGSTNPNRILLLLFLVICSLFLLQAVLEEKIEPPFKPTLAPTRSSISHSLEAQTRFNAGDLDGSIKAYQDAIALDPENEDLLVELARIQAYSSAELSTDAQKAERLKSAYETINKAVEIAPDNSNAVAVQAFVLNWYASPLYVGDDYVTMLSEAEQAAVRALTLDNQNTLALAYYAETLVDQQRLIQAEQTINSAIEREEQIMDVYRVNGYVRESLGYYGDAVREYQKAVEITPNLTFLLVRIGVNYRQLKQYDMALEYFAKAAHINEQIGVQDPTPYLAIGNTYSQMGEFFIAARNVEKVLEFDPTNPEIYATLGMIYFKSRNYEGAIPTLKCATYGCNTLESCTVRMGDEEYCDTEEELDGHVTVEGLPLSSSSLVYYYTYGSVLAGMHRPYNDYCTESLEVMADVREEFGSDEATMQIIETSEEICASFGYARQKNR